MTRVPLFLILFLFGFLFITSVAIASDGHGDSTDSHASETDHHSSTISRNALIVGGIAAVIGAVVAMGVGKLFATPFRIETKFTPISFGTFELYVFCPNYVHLSRHVLKHDGYTEENSLKQVAFAHSIPNQVHRMASATHF